MKCKRNCSVTTELKKTKTTNHPQIVYLPEDIIRYILVRLPVRSLLKFRCVSKLWLCLISSSQFVKHHLEFSTNNAAFTNQRIVITSAKQPSNLQQCSVSSLMSETTVTSDVDYPNNFSFVKVTVVGSCDGIICISIDSNVIVLLNPSTTKSKVLPTIPTRNRWDYFYMLGFGYSESGDDYKVVCIYHAYDANESHVSIYSLRTDSWKRIENFRFGIPLFRNGKFASGKLYFTTLYTENKVGRKYGDIVSLDLKSEVYAILKKPNCGDGCSFTSLRLLGGCLSFVSHYERIRTDVWILKEYDGNESWTKVVSVPYFNDPHNHYIMFDNPLLIMPNGEIVFDCWPSLVVYNSRDSCFRYLQLTNRRSLCVYFESLVPL